MPSREEFLRHEFESRINRAVDYAYDNCHRDFDLAEMADAACFSRFHFQRTFLAMTGETPGEFVRRIRLSRAASALRNDPRKGVTEIAMDCGFSGPSVFARQFKDRFGVSASEYRSGAPQPGQGSAPAKSNGGQAVGKGGKAPRGAMEYLGIIDTIPRRTGMKKLTYAVEVRKLKDLTVAYTRHEGDYADVGEAFGRLMRWAGPRGYLGPNGMMLGVYNDDPDTTPEDKLRSSACVAVPAGTKAEGAIGVRDLPGGDFAVGRFEIDKSEFGDAWSAMMGEWMPGSGWQPDDRPCYEVYLNRHETHPERKFIIDICVPVRTL